MFKETISCKLKIHLLGEFLFLLDGKPIAGLNPDRPQSLLTFLLLHRHAPQSRQHLAFRLWPDSPEGQARTNLRNLLHTVRHSLPDANSFIIADGATLQWHTDVIYELDVAIFEAAIQEAERSNQVDTIRDCLETAVSFYQGDLLPGNYDDWLIPIREKFRQQYLQALRKLVMLLEGQGEYRLAAHYCQEILQLDPLDEAVAVYLMRLHALNGERAAVRRTFQTLASTLQCELGIAPASATQEAYRQLLSLETKQPLAIMVMESPGWQPRPLPIPPTPFIGREAELAETAELLANPACRLLTILGPGGMGKSRLALQTAVGHQPIFADGIAYASLAALDSSQRIIPALAEALNFTLTISPDPAAQLLNFLRQKEILLVLDNFEHLLDGVCLLAEILTQVPGAKILITSRQRLDLQEEWVYAIQGLPLPNERGDEGIGENSSVLLFLQSARRCRHSFTLAEANRAAIVRICHLVGGMPLGLELAASWVHSLSCTEIAREIERDLDFLTVTTRNVAGRHRSIRAVFDYSWQLLSLEEQQILKRLSLFDTSFSREVVDEVAGVSLVQLLSLVDKLLIHRIDKNRYQLPQLFRRFVASLLPEDHLEDNSQ
ncbi:MAG: hypothetical protein CL608_07995 [Anaerolineaceae bacterium]|nr:hypothetical protein [Anaerolineaceae bacterium]